MNNWKLRLGAGLMVTGASVAAIQADANWWVKSGLLLIAAGAGLKVIFPETDGGQKAETQLPPNPK